MRTSHLWRGVFGIIFAAALVGIARLPAAAADASVLTFAGPNPYTGACPTTLTFNGAISGTGGSSVTYLWARFVNGMPVDSAPVTITLPGNGLVSVPLPPQSLAVDKSTAGFQSYALYITSPATADNTKGKIFFTVNCVDVSKYAMNSGLHSLVRPVVTLHAQWWATRQYYYQWVGLTTYLPESGLRPCGNFCVGWNHVKNGDSAWLFHYNAYVRAFMGFDQGSLNGLNVTKATLTLSVKDGTPSCFGNIGRALLDKQGINPSGTQEFQAPYPQDGDFFWPVSTQFGGGSATFDVTSIVKKWADGTMRDDGFVLRANNENNGSDGNDSCALDFNTDGVLTIQQM